MKQTKQIFICGNSGTGKTTFCNLVSETYKELKYVKEIIRRMPNSSQLSYLLAYNDIHKLNNIISDRSILDVIIFNAYNLDVLNYIKNTFKKPSIVIVTPDITEQRISSTIATWVNDEVRLKAYLAKFNKDADFVPTDFRDREWFIHELYKTFHEERNKIINCLEFVNWNYILAESKSEDYYSWTRDPNVIDSIDEIMQAG